MQLLSKLHRNPELQAASQPPAINRVLVPLRAFVHVIVPLLVLVPVLVRVYKL
jgi:hypothetical protein